MHFIDVPAKLRILKPDAVPSCNLPKAKNSTEKQKLINQERQRRRYTREQKRNNWNQRRNIEMEKDLVGEECQSYEQIEVQNIENQKFCDVAIQIDAALTETLCYFIRTKKDLSTMCGIESFLVLDTIVEILNEVYPDPCSTYDYQTKVILTFVKLKLNLSYSALSVLFKGISIVHIRHIFLQMLTLLSTVLSYAIYFPSKEEIQKNIPLCFIDFLDVRVILDCTEIPIQKKKNICCQTITYSNYKSTYTVKFMTGVTSAGLISFISRAYGGKASDKVIFEQSNLINLLQKGEAIMVDKGFLIDNICLQNGIKLIRPTFLRKKTRFSKEEALLNVKIAKARVHIERTNQRLKTFKILSDKMPQGLISKVEQIFLIISAIVNLSSSIFKDDKFVS